MVASDLTLVEVPAPVTIAAGVLKVVSEDAELGSVLAMSGTRLLVNTRGIASEKLSRASKVTPLAEKVRRREVQAIGRAAAQKDAAPELTVSLSDAFILLPSAQCDVK